MVKTKDISKQGLVEVTTPEEAAQAVAQAHEIKLKIKPALDEMERLRGMASTYMSENDIKQVDLPDMNAHGTLIQRYSHTWDRKMLLKLVKKAKGKNWKEAWQAITTRQPDPEKIQEATKAGKINGDAISSALITTAQKPYVQVYDD